MPVPAHTGKRNREEPAQTVAPARGIGLPGAAKALREVLGPVDFAVGSGKSRAAARMLAER